jgi:hypothetical protein
VPVPVPLALSSPPHPAATAASAKTDSRAARRHPAPLLFDPYNSLLTFILLTAKLDGTSRLKAQR